MTTDKETVAKIIAIFQSLESKWSDFRQSMILNYKFVIGDQIDEKVRKQLKADMRPDLVFNLCQRVIVALAGIIETNHAYMKAVPVREGDEQLADMHTVIVSDYAMKNCNGYKEIAKAAVDAAIAKIGWANNFVDYRRNPEGDWVTESFDPFMIMFDPLTRKKDMSDCRYYVVSAFYTIDEIIAIYRKYLDPESIKEMRAEDSRIMGTKPGQARSWWQRLTGAMSDLFDFKNEEQRIREQGSINAFLDVRNGIYRVIEFHDRRIITKKSVYDPMTRQKLPIRDQAEEEDQTQYDQYVTDMETSVGGVQWEDTSEMLYVTACVPGLFPDRVIFEKPYPVQGAGFQHKPIWAYDFHPDPTKTQSLMDALLDPQRGFNQRRSTSLEMIMDAVNPSWSVSKSSIDPIDMDDWKSKKRGRLLFWHGIVKPEPIHPHVGAIEGLKMMGDEDRDLIESIGISPNAMGEAQTKQESGILYAQRVKQSMGQISYFMGNVTFAMELIFNYCDKNIQRFMTAPRSIRLLDKTNNPSWIKVNWPTIQGVLNDVTEGEYDFVVDSSQVGETAKQMQFAMITEAIKTVPPELVYWPKYIKMWEVPDAEEMAAYAEQMMQGQQQAQAQQQQMQQEQQKLQLMQGAGQTVQTLEAAASSPENESQTSKKE